MEHLTPTEVQHVKDVKQRYREGVYLTYADTVPKYGTIGATAVTAYFICNCEALHGQRKRTLFATTALGPMFVGFGYYLYPTSIMRNIRRNDLAESIVLARDKTMIPDPINEKPFFALEQLQKEGRYRNDKIALQLLSPEEQKQLQTMEATEEREKDLYFGRGCHAFLVTGLAAFSVANFFMKPHEHARPVGWKYFSVATGLIAISGIPFMLETKGWTRRTEDALAKRLLFLKKLEDRTPKSAPEPTMMDGVTNFLRLYNK